jgi:hypothetical protein
VLSAMVLKLPRDRGSIAHAFPLGAGRRCRSLPAGHPATRAPRCDGAFRRPGHAPAAPSRGRSYAGRSRRGRRGRPGRKPGRRPGPGGRPPAGYCVV